MAEILPFRTNYQEWIQFQKKLKIRFWSRIRGWNHSISTLRMKTATDRSSAALAIFVGSRARATLSAAAGTCPDTARSTRVIVILTTSAMVHLYVGSTTAFMSGTLWTVAGRGTYIQNSLSVSQMCCRYSLRSL